MEAAMVDHHSIPSSNNKQIRTPKNKTRAFISKRAENLAPMNSIHGSLLYAPPASLSSYPCSSSLFPHQYPTQIKKLKNPPLLPLPIPRPHPQFAPSLTRGFSCPPTTRKSNRVRDHSLTPKKPKSKSPNKIEEPKLVTQSLLIYSKNPLGADPNDFPQVVPTVLLSNLENRVVVSDVEEELEKLSGSLFSLSPHPSSLPLPKFSMRPKLSCNAEAAGFDAGATDNLRRMLRLL